MNSRLVIAKHIVLFDDYIPIIIFLITYLYLYIFFLGIWGLFWRFALWHTIARFWKLPGTLSRSSFAWWRTWLHRRGTTACKKVMLVYIYTKFRLLNLFIYDAKLKTILLLHPTNVRRIKDKVKNHKFLFEFPALLNKESLGTKIQNNIHILFGHSFFWWISSLSR